MCVEFFCSIKQLSFFRYGRERENFSLSQKGASIFKADKVVTIPTIQVRALHTVGAGDSFNAGFLHGVLKNYSILKSIRFANTYAA